MDKRPVVVWNVKTDKISQPYESSDGRVTSCTDKSKDRPTELRFGNIGSERCNDRGTIREGSSVVV